MSKSSIFSLVSVTALCLGLIVPAGATTVTIGATAPAGFTPTAFMAANATSGPGSWIFSSGASTANTGNGGCIDPLGNGTTTYFACIAAGSSITANFAGGITGFDLDWGSPDGYNTLTFYTGLNGTGTAQAYIPGTPPLVINVAPLADPVLFVADPGVIWESVTFTSTFNSYEFASVSTLAASPEPSSIALLAGGLLAIGASALRRRRSS